MWEHLVELIKFWKLSPFAVMGWGAAALFGFALIAMYKGKEAAAREAREWLKEDTEAKMKMAQALERAATSHQRAEATLTALERTLAVLLVRLEK